MDRTGVSSKRGHCQISFVYNGKRYRPVLTGLLYSRATDRKLAERKLAVVQSEIELGKFYFPSHFPKHPDARRLQKGHQITVADALNDWLEEKRSTVEATTAHAYEKGIRHHLIPTFGHMRLSEVLPSDVSRWLAKLAISGKTKNNVLIPLRAVFNQAFRDDRIERDPLAKIANCTFRTPPADPFSRAEMEAILRSCSGQIQNVFEFAFWTGLRTSELIAIRWQDVDLDKGKVHVRTTRTYRGQKARGKTIASLRAVDLLLPARNALLRQKDHTEGKAEVFENPHTGRSWKHDAPLRRTAWMPAIKAAGVRYRCPYQTRHTYASMLLSAGVDPTYLAQQMGHKDWGMLRKVYGKWLSDFSGAQTDKVAVLWAPQGNQVNANP
ncbi:MAG: tyrosine-type recombinase/integrase [Pseudomonadota bacterium]